MRSSERILTIDELSLDELRQGLFERKRALLARNGDLLMQMVRRVLAHVLARAVADHQEFRRWDEAAADPRDENLRQAALADVSGFARNLGLRLVGSIDAPIKGAAGNLEFLCVFSQQAEKAA